MERERNNDFDILQICFNCILFEYRMTNLKNWRLWIVTHFDYSNCQEYSGIYFKQNIDLHSPVRGIVFVRRDKWHKGDGLYLSGVIDDTEETVCICLTW